MGGLRRWAVAGLALLLACGGCADSAGSPCLIWRGVDPRQREASFGIDYTPDEARGSIPVAVATRVCLTTPGEVTITAVRLYHPSNVVLLDAALDKVVHTPQGALFGMGTANLPRTATRLSGPHLYRLPQRYGFTCPAAQDTGSDQDDAIVTFLLGYSGQGSIEGIDVDYLADGVARSSHLLFSATVSPKTR